VKLEKPIFSKKAITKINLSIKQIINQNRKYCVKALSSLANRCIPSCKNKTGKFTLIYMKYGLIT